MALFYMPVKIDRDTHKNINKNIKNANEFKTPQTDIDIGFALPDYSNRNAKLVNAPKVIKTTDAFDKSKTKTDVDEPSLIVTDKSINDFDDCINYEFKFWHLFLPPVEIFSYICVSTDKTKIFLTNLLRFIIFMTITAYFYDYVYNSTINKTDEGKYIDALFWITAGVTAIYGILVFYSIIKKQKYEKKDV